MKNTPPTLAELHAVFVQLRESWPNDWVGLPAILSDCLRQLGYREDQPLSENARSILNCMSMVAVAIEQDGLQRHHHGGEPPYHNRLHIADTLYSMTSLLLATRAWQHRSLANVLCDAEWVLMLAMLAHDFLHPGRVNQFPGEIESQSASAVQPLMQAAGVPEEVRALVGELILMTDPARVSSHHESMRNRAFNLDDADCMAMLLQECDILASAMPDIGIGLTFQLASEWSKFSETMGDSLLLAGNRINFLRNQARFSSPASQSLGLSSMTATEIDRLGGVPADLPVGRDGQPTLGTSWNKE